MKFFRKTMIFGLMLLLSVFVSQFVGNAIDVSPGIIFAASTVVGLSLSFLPKQAGVLRADVELWQSFIAENLFRGMEFIKNAFNADQYVVGGRVVHIPNAGTPGGAKRNRTNLPAGIIKRSDTDVTYALDEFTTDPILITNIEEAELSYDKKASLLSDIMGVLKQLIGDWIPYKWAPAASILRTTGDSVAAHLTSATGNRKKLSLADIRAAKVFLNKQPGAVQADRFALIDSNMLDQLISELTATQYKDFSAAYNSAEGIIGKLEGFNIIERPQVIAYTNAGTPVVKAPDAAGATTDNGAAFFWQKNAVEKAEGSIEVFANENDATYFGTILSALVRLGGRIRRSDEKGIVSIVQTAV